jgi:hypothetical protein
MFLFISFRLANIHFNRLANILLFVGTLLGCMGVSHRKEGMIQVLAGFAPSSQTVGSILRTSWSKADRKMVVLN